MTKATLRKSGEMMVTIRLPFHVGFEDVVLTLIENCYAYGWDLSTGKIATWQRVKEFMVDYGHHGWAYVGDEARAHYGKVCAARAAELFPELAKGVDLKVWDLEPSSE